jgi:ABC-type Zn uptake system ZnuABC Zn-binding protein ZnuA
MAVVLLLAVTACGRTPATSSAGGQLRVLSTVTQVSALVRAVGGDRIQLTDLLTPTDDPHQYDLRPGQAVSLAQAQLIFESGAGLDKWLDKGLAGNGNPDRVVDLSKNVKLRPAPAGSQEGTDPHWWYDAHNAKQAADVIAGALAKADPQGAAGYGNNADQLKRRLDDSDLKIRMLIDPIPPARRLFVANHDAFNYFLARYRITLVGDLVPSTDSIQAIRPAELSRLVADIRDRHVCAIFTETTLDPKLAQQVAGEAKVKVFDGKLYGDAIGPVGTAGGTLEGALLRDGQLMAQAFTSC